MAEKVEFYKETEFKDTEIGRIPKEWEVVRIKDLGEVITGTTPSTLVKDYWNGIYPFVTPTDFSETKYVYKTERKVTQKGVEKGRLIPKDSVLVVCIGSTIGKISLSSEECITNQQINAIICKDRTNPHYVYYAIASRKDTLRAQAGITAKPIIKKSLFEKLHLPLPSTLEQQKIASILSTVDESIQKTDDIIAKTERLKKGLMQELLTRGIGHTEFKDTEIGKLPEEWKTSNLGEVSYLIMGQSPPSKTYNRDMIGLPFLQGRMDFGDMYPNPSVYCSKPIKIAEEGDVLVSVRAPVGDVNIATSKLCIGRGLAAIRPDKNQLDAKFIFYQLKHFSARLVDLGSGSTFKAIRRNDLERFPTVLPPLSEQQKIAEILSTVDEKLETLKQEKAKLERMKQWFMEELLSGRIRVRVA